MHPAWTAGQGPSGARGSPLTRDGHDQSSVTAAAVRHGIDIAASKASFMLAVGAVASRSSLPNWKRIFSAVTAATSTLQAAEQHEAAEATT